MKKSHIIWVVLILLLALVVIVLRRSSPPPSPSPASTTDLTVSFGGFTNTAKGPAAIFLFTNATPKAVHFEVADVEQRTDSGWPSLPLTEANSFRDTSGQPVSMTSSLSTPVVGIVPSGGGFRWAVAIPTTGTTWRLRLSCHEHVDGDDPNTFKGRRYEVVSPGGEK